jgi:hypothetical protein
MRDLLPEEARDRRALSRIVLERSTRHGSLVAQAAEAWQCEVVRERVNNVVEALRARA